MNLIQLNPDLKLEIQTKIMMTVTSMLSQARLAWELELVTRAVLTSELKRLTLGSHRLQPLTRAEGSRRGGPSPGGEAKAVVT